MSIIQYSNFETVASSSVFVTNSFRVSFGRQSKVIDTGQKLKLQSEPIALSQNPNPSTNHYRQQTNH